MRSVQRRTVVRAIALFACVAVVLAAGVFAPKAGIAESTPSAPAVTEGLKKPGVLTVGVRKSSSAPFCFESRGHIYGMDVELGCSLADALGLKAEFVAVDDVAKALAESCDVVMNVPTKDANGFDVVGDYAETALSLFHKGSPAVANVDDLTGKTVAVQGGSSAQVSLRVTALDTKEDVQESLNEAIEELDEGKADYVFCNSPSGSYLTWWRDDLSFAGALSEPSPQGIAISSGEGQLQSAVRNAYDQMSQNGILSEIRRCWLGNTPKLTGESVIKDIPMKETSGVSLDDVTGEDEVMQVSMDGSSAGSNAVTISESQSMGANFGD